jgi:hypothetical protein
MKLSGRVVGVGALLAAIVLAFALRGTSSGDSPEHRTDSDAANGASALVQLASALDHPTTVLQDRFQPDLGMGVLFVLTPTVGFTTDEAARAVDYVRGGGVLVYAAEQGDPQLDQTLQVTRQRAIASGDAAGAGPQLAGVSHVAGAQAVRPLAPGPAQVVLLRSASGQPIAFEQFVGRGRLVALADPLPLCNGDLEQADNWRLASDLVSLAPPGTRVAFDEYHHAPVGVSSPLTGWLSTAWGAAIAWAVLLAFAGLLLRGRAFGPRLALPGAAVRSSAEHVVAVGGLLARSRAATATGRLLVAATRRALAARHGMAPGPGFERALEQRAPDEADELRRAETELERGGDADAALLAAARRLHPLVYPDHPPANVDGKRGPEL